MAATPLVDYTGKQVVVTGGSSGVGASLVDLLHGLGATVTVLDRNDPPAELGSSIAKFIKVDLADPSSIDAAIAEAPATIDTLFNNAGVAATVPARVVIAVNCLAVRRLSEGLLPRIPARGAIVNTASMAGQGWPGHLTEINEFIDIGDWNKSLEWVDAHSELMADPYLFSKEIAQVWVTRSSHATMAKSVRTCSVCPGIIDTPLLTDFRATMSDKVVDWTVNQSTGNLCTPRQVADVLAFLGSSAAALISGANVYADYGFSSDMATGQVDFTDLM
jgi:NAD(P)-dependent dehydrogenase (short-subunit alcohol dehydrogenase family)